MDDTFNFYRDAKKGNRQFSAMKRKFRWIKNQNTLCRLCKYEKNKTFCQSRLYALALVCKSTYAILKKKLNNFQFTIVIFGNGLLV